ncbi:hypothetical protein Tco_0989925 [Tanacetum coccineum]|uniref:Uncharacterized protein n=1 Tax=Tanacetum coccineum TaxID=301880 RepID=A0ABQ5EV09_9ASTR
MINIKRTPFGLFLLRSNAPFGYRGGGGSGDVMVVRGDDDVVFGGGDDVGMDGGCRGDVWGVGWWLTKETRVVVRLDG